jgi:uncharacterized NAD(P)/FAD-binding protein YdhS
MGEADVAILGGGAGGTLVAIQLLRQTRSPLSIALVEPGERLGRGVAYSTREPEHLLNVPAGKLSALPDAPDHFARWAQSPEGAFVARGRYGDYLDHTLREAAARAARDVSFQIRRDTAIGVAKGHGSVRLAFASGEQLDAGIAVLALGNLPAADLAVDDGGLYATGRYARSPFLPGALDGVDPDAPVVFLGSGLTMVDAAVSLRARVHRGRLYAISRHGLIPQVHAASRPSRARVGGIGVRGLLRALRTQASRAGDWRSVFDSFRTATQRIWVRLPLAERKRSLRHVRAYWEVHRHRMAPPVGAAISAMLESGQLSIHAGRIASFAVEPQSGLVRYRPRGSREVVEIRCARVVNCMGPATRVDEARSPLLSSLLASGLARPGSLGMGLATDPDGAVLGSSDIFSPGSSGDPGIPFPSFESRRELGTRIVSVGSIPQLRHASL